MTKYLFMTLWSLLLSTTVAQKNDFRIGPGLIYGDTSELHQLVLDNYSRFVGTAISLRDSELYFRIHGAEDTSVFLTTQLRYLGLLAESVHTGGVNVHTDSLALAGAVPTSKLAMFDGQYDLTFTDPTYLRTAFLNKGKGQLRLVNAIYNVLEVNATKNIQIGGGLLLPFGFLFTQRLGFKVAGPLHIGVSNQAFLPIGAFAPTTLYGDLSLNLSVGNDERFFSIGRGMLYDTEFAEEVDSYTLSIGGKIKERVHIYGEIMLLETAFGRTNLLPSLSAAFTNRRHRLRAGIFRIIETGVEVFALPLLGYELKF